MHIKRINILIKRTIKESLILNMYDIDAIKSILALLKVENKSRLLYFYQ